MALVQLMEQGQLWRGTQDAGIQAEALESSGYPELDARLGGGWLKGQLIELLQSGEGRGELRLLWPLLRRAEPERPVFWIDPPHQPCALSFLQADIRPESQQLVRTHSMKERLWAIEQALKSGCAPLVLSWLGEQVTTPALRRLQLAAQTGGGLGLIMRPDSVRSQSSPAAYRLHLDSSDKGAEVALLKRRGGWPLPAAAVDLPAVI
ncbi:translesion DNA synthesis-associated protein ImuA [Marinobacterium lutimaris]|uniref:SOS cell division inhibitor SulA n=1 Tax=Marinobacterium lutimaris TaxID=568106 RepID=A0A1H6DQX1_9GAMM|nr:translesion DNA synthesis-associated protein ImuA [Marinobacterium lutimaris]SEG87651.1 SOS cell division inhibitor SulA [Marinobacterium lutimaris]